MFRLFENENKPYLLELPVVKMTQSKEMIKHAIYRVNNTENQGKT